MNALSGLQVLAEFQTTELTIDTSALGPLLPILIGGIGFFFFLIMVMTQWTIFAKAKQPGWASLIPFYNNFVFVKMVNRPDWWFVMTLIPVVNIVFGIILIHDLSRAFGKGAGYTLGIIFFWFIFLPMLAFGRAKYRFPQRDEYYDE